MPDRLFAVPELARLYDPLDPHRRDLENYVRLLDDLDAHSVIDVGCGTGALALLLARRGMSVIALDPASASLDVARAKPGAEKVHWIHGEFGAASEARVDAVTMTGNVAQVFLTDDDWRDTLLAAHRSLRPGGHLVFESRDPAAEAWLGWTRDLTYRTAHTDLGPVACFEEVTSVDWPCVSFESTFVLPGDRIVTSASTLRFRDHEELVRTVGEAGFRDVEVRDAPDRAGMEYVVIARRP